MRNSIENDLRKILSLDFPERIERLAELAKKTSPNDKSRFAPPADIEIIIEFEKKFNIKLPEAVKIYLTEVGNGCMTRYGICSAVYSLREMEDHNFHLPGYADKKTFFDLGDPEDVFNKLKEHIDNLANEINELDENDGDTDELIEEYENLLHKSYCEVCSGMLFIGTEGCTIENFVMLNGSKAGFVGSIDVGTDLDTLPTLYNMKFEEWLEDYFIKIITG